MRRSRFNRMRMRIRAAALAAGCVLGAFAVRADDCALLRGTLVGTECVLTNAVTTNGTFTIDNTLRIAAGGGIKVPVSTTVTNKLVLNVDGDVYIETGGYLDGSGSSSADHGAHITIDATGSIFLEGTGSTGALVEANSNPSSCSGGGDSGSISLFADVAIRIDDGAMVSSQGRCPAGTIRIQTEFEDIVIDGIVEASVPSGLTGSGSSFPPDGGPIFVISHCDLEIGDTGIVRSEGRDRGGNLVHLEAGCEVGVYGLVASTGPGHGIPNNPPNLCAGTNRPGKNASSTACVEVWAGGNIHLDRLSRNGEINADTAQAGGTQGHSWIDLIAGGVISVTGTNAGTGALHANQIVSSSGGGDISIISTNGSIVLSNRAAQADGGYSSASDTATAGSKGGTVYVEAKYDIDLGQASVRARGANSGGGGQTGGQIRVVSYKGSIRGNSPGELNADGGSNVGKTGVVTFVYCQSTNYTGTITPQPPKVIGPVCTNSLTLGTNILLPICQCPGIYMTKGSSATNEVDAGENITYTLTLLALPLFEEIDVTVNDAMSPDLTYVTNSSRVTTFSNQSEYIFLDSFGTRAYTNQHGNATWLNNWQEQGESDGPVAGNILLPNTPPDYFVRMSSASRGFWRMANLTAATNAFFSFDYSVVSLEDTGEFVTVYVSSNGTNAWTVLNAWTGPITTLSGLTNYDITAYIATNTAIRFTTSAGMESSDNVDLDDMKILQTVGPSSMSSTAGTPPTLVSGYPMNPGEYIVITYTASVGIAESIVNQACATALGRTNIVCASTEIRVKQLELTQGVFSVQATPQGALLAWTAGNAPITKPFDLIWVDRANPGFHSSVTDEWARMTTVTNSYALDTNYMALGTAMRFYRASLEGTWAITREKRIASKEIYVAKDLRPVPGENWLSLCMIPDSNCMLQVFGTNRLPASDNIAYSSKIEWYGASQNGEATNIVWLDGLTRTWRFESGANANNYRVPLNEGFNLIVPDGSNVSSLIVIGRLPTNASAANGQIQTLQGSGVYNVVNYNLPYRLALKNSGLREAGLVGPAAGQEVNPNNSDEIRILQRGGGSLASPKARILLDQNRQFVFWTGGSGSAEDYEFEVDDAIIVYTHRSTNNRAWSVSLPYPVPTVDMKP